MDYAFLRAEGMRHLERMAGQRWTDFNAHDPGITILEQLCYAMTELGYRIAHDMPDLLARDSAAYQCLYSPATILTGAPVTMGDLRKLVLDVDGVRNAWIETMDEPGQPLYFHEGERALHLRTGSAGATADRYTTQVALAGLYRVLIEISDVADIDGATVKREVTRRLHAHRPLCCDFHEIRMLEPQAVQVQARVEIAPAADAGAVLLAAYRKLAAHLSPPVRFATLGEMLAAGKSIDEIFAGPRLQHGFLDDDALRALTRRTSLHTSDLIRALMDIPGVRVIHEIGVASGGAPEAWSLDLDPARTPRLDLEQTNITLIRDGLTVALDRERVIEEYVSQARRTGAPRSLRAEDRDRIAPAGRDRHVGRYTSIQQQLPDCYGVGALGLPASAPPHRQAKGRQLAAYLLFFDQLLANCFAQLGHAPELLSFHGTGTRTYAAQMVEDEALDLDGIRARDAGAHAAWLQAITDDPAQSRPSLVRKDRFLDHLLARFGEQLAEYAQHRAAGPAQASVGTADQRVRDKQAFLQRYPRISSARGTGLDYTRPPSDENVSGLEERIRLALGLVAEQGERFAMVEHILLRPMDEDRNQLGQDEIRPIPLLAASRYQDPYSLQVSFVFPGAPARFADPGFRAYVEQTIRAETPAHVTPYTHWLAAEDWDAFQAVHAEWLAEHQSYWAEKLDI